MHAKNQISMARKVLYGVVLVAVSLAAFDGMNLSSVGASETSTTYTDPEFGFSVNYPKDWVTEGGHLVDPYTYIWEVRFTAPSTAYRAIVVNLQPLDPSITLRDWVEIVTETNNYEELLVSGKIKEIDLDGVQAIQVFFPSNYIFTFVIAPNGYGYSISLQENGDSPANQFATPVTDFMRQEDLIAYNELIQTFILGTKLSHIQPQEKTQVNILATADSFRFPLDAVNWKFNYGDKPTWWSGTSTCFGTAYANLYHAGQDWANSAGTTVKSVANGVVEFFNPNYSTYPGRVVVVRHSLPDGSTIYSMYGHLDTVSVYQGQTISKGDAIGTILSWPNDPSNSHVHWEMRYFADGSNKCIYGSSGYYGPGYTYPNHPDNYGYTNPETFVNNHQGGCALTSVPSGYNQCADEGGFCSFSGTANVIYGANSCYTSPRSFSNGTACNNDVFGDPLPGVHKYCYTNGSGGGGSWAYQLFDLGDYNGDKYESNQTITNLTNVGWNDRAESIKINSGYEIIACEHADFQGNCGRATGPTQFSDINALAQGLRNGLSSIKVCVGSCPNPPSAPSLISPSNGQFFNEGESITLSWTATGSDYYGEIWGGPGGTLTFGWQSGSSKNIGSQWAGYTYYWHVKARNSVGESGWSNTWSFIVRPAAPTNLSASVISCGQINLSWNDNSANEEGYKVYRNGALIATLGSGATTYQDSGLSGNTSYSYVVKAYRNSIESNASNTANATTSNCGPNPPSLNSPANNTTLNRTDSVNLSWNTVSGATQYYAEFTGGPGTNINSGWISNTSWSLGSQWGGVYQWRVKARNSSGVESGWSETRTLNIRSGTPSNLSASVLSSDQIRLSWNASSDAPGNIDGYRIYRDGSAVATVNGSTTTYQNDGLTCNTGYSYYVRAYKGSLESNSSNTVSATTQPCPPPIRAIGADTRDGNWGIKTSFNPGDPIQWTVHVENTTGSDAQVEIGFTVKNPSNVVIHNSTHTVTTGAGTWLWGLPSTVELPGGTYTFIGSVTSQGVKTERTATYTVTGPSIITAAFNSNGIEDGYIWESTETSNRGLNLNSTNTTFLLGDDNQDRQYRAILSFNTAELPDNAVITSVTLKIRQYGLPIGTSPFTTHGGLKIDVRMPFFGPTVNLAAGDFQAGASRPAVGTFNSTPVNNWYSAILGSTAYPYINLTGTTQFRLRFAKDDNDDMSADYLRFFSGNYSTANYRPTLIIEYYVPSADLTINESLTPTPEYHQP